MCLTFIVSEQNFKMFRLQLYTIFNLFLSSLMFSVKFSIKKKLYIIIYQLKHRMTALRHIVLLLRRSLKLPVFSFLIVRFATTSGDILVPFTLAIFWSMALASSLRPWLISHLGDSGINLTIQWQRIMYEKFLKSRRNWLLQKGEINERKMYWIRNSPRTTSTGWKWHKMLPELCTRSASHVRSNRL